MRHLSYAMALLATGSGFALLTAGACFPFAYESGGAGGGGTSTSSTGGGVPCSVMSSCDEGNPCTTDACTKGFCTHTPLDTAMVPGSTECMTIDCADGTPMTTIHDGSPCGMGLHCVKEVCKGCTANIECGKTDECQKSTCLPNKTCEYVYTTIGTKVNAAKLIGDMPGDCMSTICNGTGTVELFADAMDPPDDKVECTDGQCLNGKPMQIMSAVGAPCTGGLKFCNSAQSCAPCAIDTNCPAGTTCYQMKECVSCIDTKKNGDETDIDCGGACGNTCLDGKNCNIAGDCKNNLCTGGKCIGCFDGIKNNGEAGKDCGGPCALKCPDATPCMSAGDCITDQCADGVCCNTACTDTCTACNIPAKEGTCTQLAKGHDDSNPVCSDTKVCETGMCKNDGSLSHFGESCSNASQCFSGVCVGVPLVCN